MAEQEKTGTPEQKDPGQMKANENECKGTEISAGNYIAEGFGALPLKFDKSPALPVGHPYLYELIPDEKIKPLFEKADKIGIACGLVSGGFMALDFDKHQGQDIDPIFEAFMSNDPARLIIETHQLPIYKTPSGGYHIYFKSETRNRPGTVLAKWADDKTMIEVRGHGQYVCVAPSAGYEPITGGEILKVATVPDEEVNILYDTAMSLTQFVSAPDTEKKTGGRWPDKFDVSLPIGRFNETETEFAKDLLFEAGWTFVNTRPDGVEYWRRPGKTEGISATFGRNHNMFYNFSGSAGELPELRGLTLFDILMALKFGGDFNAAKKFVSDRYKPTPTPRAEVERRIREAATEQEVEPEPEPEQVPFPFEAFPEYVSRFCKSLAFEQELNPEIVVMEMLALAGVINGNRYKIEIHPGWHVPSLLWIALSGATGTQKTGHLKIVTGPLAQIVREDYKNWAQAHNDFLAAKGKKGAKPGPEPEPHVIQIGDTTQAGIVRALKTNTHGMVVTTPEGTSWLGGMAKFNQNGSSDRPFYLEAFDNGSYLVMRGAAGYTYLESIFFSIVIGIQNSKLNQIFGNAQDSDGFADRFIFVPIPSKLKVWTTESRDATCYRNLCQTVYGLQKDLRRAYQTHGTHLLTLDRETQEFRTEYMNRTERSKHSEEVADAEVGFKSKYITYQDRLALCTCLLRALIEGTEIRVTIDDYRTAVAILEWQEGVKAALYREARGQSEIAELTRTMAGKMTKEEKCVTLKAKGWKNSEIGRELGMAPGHVTRALKRQGK